MPHSGKRRYVTVRNENQPPDIFAFDHSLGERSHARRFLSGSQSLCSHGFAYQSTLSYSFLHTSFCGLSFISLQIFCSRLAEESSLGIVAVEYVESPGKFLLATTATVGNPATTKMNTTIPVRTTLFKFILLSRISMLWLRATH